MVEHHVNWTWYLANLYLTAWATIPNETVQNEAGTWLSVLKPHPFQWPSFVGSGQSLEAWSPCSSWTIVKKSVWNNGFHTQSHTHTHVMLRLWMFSCTCTRTPCYAIGRSLALAHARQWVGRSGVGWANNVLLHLHAHILHLHLHVACKLRKQFFVLLHFLALQHEKRNTFN